MWFVHMQDEDEEEDTQVTVCYWVWLGLAVPTTLTLFSFSPPRMTCSRAETLVTRLSWTRGPGLVSKSRGGTLCVGG